MSVESAPVPSDPLQPTPIQATAQPPVDRLDVGLSPSKNGRPEPRVLLVERPDLAQPYSLLLAKLEQLKGVDLTAHQRLSVQMLLSVQNYLLQMNVPDNFLTMSPGQIVQMVKDSNAFYGSKHGRPPAC